jgi:hypothetical protein
MRISYRSIAVLGSTLAIMLVAALLILGRSESAVDSDLAEFLDRRHGAVVVEARELLTPVVLPVAAFTGGVARRERLKIAVVTKGEATQQDMSSRAQPR